MDKYIPEELVPPEGDEGVGPAIARMLSEILTYREDEKISTRCNRFYKMKRNKHWQYEQLPGEDDTLSLLSANLCGTHHKKTVNMLTDNDPTFDIVPDGEMGEDGDEKLSLQKHNVDTWWRDREQQGVFRESVSLGELYGTVGEFGYFDETIDYPHGDVSFDSLDMMYFSLYPPKCRQQRKAEAFLRWYPKTVREARRLWPESADKIVGDMSLLEEIGDERQQEHKNTDQSLKQVVISTVVKFLSGKKSQGEIKDTDETFIIEAWVKDYSLKDNGDPVYPGNIRRVIVCNGGDVVLDDRYNPSLNPELDEEIHQNNYLYSRWPASYIQPVPDESSPFGLSDFEQLEQLNVELNKAISQFVMFKDGAVRLKILNPKDSGVSNHELNNVSGILNPTNSLVSGGIKYIDPPVMGQDIPSSLALFKDLFNEIAGSFSDVTQGQKAGSEVVAAKAIALLLETESRMARGKGQAYQRMLRERGRIFLALDQMWRTKPRYVTYQKDGQKIVKGVTGEDLRYPGKLGVVSGSTLPVSDIHKREETVSLFKMGIVDQEEAMKALEIDNYKDILLRMQQGPLGQYLAKLNMVGVPQPILQFFQKLGQMDEKAIEKAVKEGAIPNFIQVMQQILWGQQPPPPDPEVMKAQAEIQINAQKIEIEAKKVQIDEQKAQAEIQRILSMSEKERVETELFREKIISEISDRDIRRAGVKFDSDNINIQKTKTIADIQDMRRRAAVETQDQKTRTIKTASDIAARDHDEKIGIKDMEYRQKMDMADRNDPGMYNERGMKSNNKRRKK